MSDVAIVGGGLAGGAAATLLARAGRQVTLLEREAEPTDKICGEFLSIEAQGLLQRLGLDPGRLGAARIATLRLVSGGRCIETALPFVALGLTRKRLDAALLDLADAAGAKIERGVAVRAIADGRLDTAAGTVEAPTLLLASGKHEVRGAPRDISDCDTGYVGFKSYWRVHGNALAGIEGRIDVVLFAGGYAGLQCVENGIVNLCLLIRKSRLAELGGNWPALRAEVLQDPHLAAILGDAEEVLARPLTIAGVPYGFLHRDMSATRMFRLGDQAAVIPSFSGDGMAIALHSAHRAAAIVAAGGSAGDYHRALHRDLAPQIRLAVRLQRLGEGEWSRRCLWAMLGLAPGLASRLIVATRVRPSGRTSSLVA